MVHYIVLAVVAVFGLTALGAPVCVQAEEAISDLRALAEDGDASAQSELGGMYLYGRGVAQDDAEAVRWFRLAADQGDASAQAKLGGMYLYGLGVAQDEAEAFRWCRRAADQGDASAQFFLGTMHASVPSQKYVAIFPPIHPGSRRCLHSPYTTGTTRSGAL